MISMFLLIPPAWGFVTGYVHRRVFSPFIANHRPIMQSVGTPTVGVLMSLIPVVGSFSILLNVLTNKRKIDAGGLVFIAALIAAYSYVSVFLGYGTAVVFSIAGGFGKR